MIERGWMPSRWTLSETTSQSVLGAEMIAVSPHQIVLAAAANPVVDLGGWQIELGDYTDRRPHRGLDPRRVASASERTNAAIVSISRPSGPRASTNADAVMMPSATGAS